MGFQCLDTRRTRCRPGVKRRYFELIRTGMSGSEAATAVGVSLSCGSLWFIDAGSVRFIDKPNISRYLTQDDRIEIADGLAAGEPVKAIAERIGKTFQSVYREIARNRKPDGTCPPWYAHAQAHQRHPPATGEAQAGRRCRTADRSGGHTIVPEMVARPRSAGGCGGSIVAGPRGTCVPRRSTRVSTGGWWSTSTNRPAARPRGPTSCGPAGVPGIGAGADGLATALCDNSRSYGQSTSDQPASSRADRRVIGRAISSWARNSGRRWRRWWSERWITLLIRLPDGHSAQHVGDALIETFNQLPMRLRRTLTWDQGNEMFHHERIEAETGLKIYFTDPHSPWQRGSNENANGLVRQYLPKGTDLSAWDDNQLRQIADELNDRPRLCLNDNAPTDLLRRWERQYALH